jgi:hypothetical protein
MFADLSTDNTVVVVGTVQDAPRLADPTGPSVASHGVPLRGIDSQSS